MSDEDDRGFLNEIAKNDTMLATVYQLGEYRLERSVGNCIHKRLELDFRGRVVKCRDCENQVDAFLALENLFEEHQREKVKLAAKAKRLLEIMDGKKLLLATRDVEKAWRKRGTLPSCPHCHRGIATSDGFGEKSMISKSIEMQRRKNEQK